MSYKKFARMVAGKSLPVAGRNEHGEAVTVEGGQSTSGRLFGSLLPKATTGVELILTTKTAIATKPIVADPRCYQHPDSKIQNPKSPQHFTRR